MSGWPGFAQCLDLLYHLLDHPESFWKVVQGSIWKRNWAAHMQCLNGLKSGAAKTKSWFDHDWKYLYKVRSDCTHFNFQFSSEGPDSSLCFFTWWWQTLPKATVKDLTHSNIQKKILWTSSVSLMLATWWVVVAISTAAMSHPLENRECLASSTTAGHGLRIEGQYNSIAV